MVDYMRFIFIFIILTYSLTLYSERNKTIGCSPILPKGLEIDCNLERIIEFNTFEIKGSDIFKKNIRKALKLLKENKPDYYKFVQERISIIEENNVSGMHVVEKPTRLELSTSTCGTPGTLWCASVLYHEAWHVELYRTGQKYSGAAAEHLCNTKQKVALSELGGSEDQLNHLQSIIEKGDHSDLDGDGDYDEDDYKLRTW